MLVLGEGADVRETLEGAVNEQGWPNAQMDDGGTGEGLLAGWVRCEGHVWQRLQHMWRWTYRGSIRCM